MGQQLEVTSIQHGCIHDGPGVRTVVFLKGCPFKCPWCCNPETLNSSPNYFIDNEKCITLKGIPSKLCVGCERKGGKRPTHICPFGVSSPTSKQYDTDILYKEIMRDRSLFKTSKGGVTFSGGEPLLHLRALLPLVERLREESIDICAETTIYIKDAELLRSCTQYIYTFIIDLKLQSENYKPDYISVLSSNLELIRANGSNVIFRLVCHKNMKKDVSIINILRSLDIDKIELLKCHSLSEAKYKKLGLQFMDYTPETSLFLEFNAFLNRQGIHTTILTI